jgi:hypothetical protein
VWHIPSHRPEEKLLFGIPPSMDPCKGSYIDVEVEEGEPSHDTKVG